MVYFGVYWPIISSYLAVQAAINRTPNPWKLLHILYLDCNKIWYLGAPVIRIIVDWSLFRDSPCSALARGLSGCFYKLGVLFERVWGSFEVVLGLVYTGLELVRSHGCFWTLEGPFCVCVCVQIQRALLLGSTSRPPDSCKTPISGGFLGALVVPRGSEPYI